MSQLPAADERSSGASTGGNETSGVRVRAEELDFDDEQTMHYQGTPFTGVAYEEEPDGLVSETEYVDGLLEGTTRVWYPSGRLKLEATYYRGVGHGWHRGYRENGMLESEKIYEYGILVESSVFNDSGDVAERFELSPDSANFALLKRYRAEFERWPADT